MGHLMRCVAVADEARERAWDVQIGGDLSAVAIRTLDRFLPGVPTENVERDQILDWLTAAAKTRPDVIHVDSYLPESDLGVGDYLLSNMQDGLHGVRQADLAIDGNLGAERRLVHGLAERALLGIAYMPIRRQVLRQRSVIPSRGRRRRLLVVIGGTDPFGLTTRVVASLPALVEPADITVVTPAEQRAEIAAAAAGQQHEIRLVPFLEDLPAAAREQDLVISAAGTSVWDFACMGVPSALLCVVDNQLDGYQAVVDAELAYGLGVPPYSDLMQRLKDLDLLLRDDHALEAFARRGRATVDGLGARRMVSVWEQLLVTGLTGRPRSAPSHD
jgi:spore coat polysaccharide biosynthesis predicted glycosyltransferase SpsG